MSALKYQEALSYLFSQLPMFSRVGAAAYKPGLDTSLAIDAHFGHPHRKFKSIHVAGTNGKGSTSHALASILQSQGYKTALYTSPHLVDFRERMKINGEMIPEEKVIEFVEKWQNTQYNGHPSFFELTMMMAFDWFADENVDYAVIEVGMGGRLDSTNIITPLGCVITNISNDHTQFLGDTLPKIALEKAGVIKKGIPVVIGEAEGDVRKVFEDKAAEVGAPITFSEDFPRLKEAYNTIEGWKCVSKEGGFIFPLGGDYQKKNLETVLHAVDMMRGVGIEISDESIVNGLQGIVKDTGLMGRWSIIATTPLTIADTGHNVAGISYNMAQLRRILPENGKLRMVIGFVADKDLEKIFKLLPSEAVYYLTNARIPRALPVDGLKTIADSHRLDSTSHPDTVTAYKAALADAGKNDIIYIGGSTFIVADFLDSTKLN